MVSLVPVCKPTISRPVQLSDPVEFESFDHLYQVLNQTRSKAKDFETVPAPRAKCRIMRFEKGSRHQQHVSCPEQDCENLVYHYDQLKSMIEILELQDTDEWHDCVKEFHHWYDKISSGNKKEAWTWEGQDDQKWKQGSSRRANSVPSSSRST